MCHSKCITFLPSDWCCSVAGKNINEMNFKLFLFLLRMKNKSDGQHRIFVVTKIVGFCLNRDCKNPQNKYERTHAYEWFIYMCLRMSDLYQCFIPFKMHHFVLIIFNGQICWWIIVVGITTTQISGRWSLHCVFLCVRARGVIFASKELLKI